MLRLSPHRGPHSLRIRGIDHSSAVTFVSLILLAVHECFLYHLQDGTVLFHDLRSNEIATRLDIDADELSSVAFSPTQSHIIYAAGGPTLNCADMRQVRPLLQDCETIAISTVPVFT